VLIDLAKAKRRWSKKIMSLVWSHNSGSAPKLAGVKKKSELLWKQQQKKQKTKQQTKPTQSKTGIVKSASSVEER
jgi:hypothetical protein